MAGTALKEASAQCPARPRVRGDALRSRPLGLRLLPRGSTTRGESGAIPQKAPRSKVLHFWSNSSIRSERSFRPRSAAIAANSRAGRGSMRRPSAACAYVEAPRRLAGSVAVVAAPRRPAPAAACSSMHRRAEPRATAEAVLSAASSGTRGATAVSSCADDGTAQARACVAPGRGVEPSTRK
jgi:hypothetical protein